MNKFEEFTIAFGATILLNTDLIANAMEEITSNHNTLIVMADGREICVKETYIEVFERLQ